MGRFYGRGGGREESFNDKRDNNFGGRKYFGRRKSGRKKPRSNEKTLILEN